MKKKLSDFLRELPQRALVVAEESFVEVAVEAFVSVKFGSPITGAPGQPSDTSYLKNSWNLGWDQTPEFPGTGEGAKKDPAGNREIPASGNPAHARRAVIATNTVYAEVVEDGVGPHGAVQYGKNGTGGSHGVKITILGLQAICDTVAARRKAAT